MKAKIILPKGFNFTAEMYPRIVHAIQTWLECAMASIRPPYCMYPGISSCPTGADAPAAGGSLKGKGAVLDETVDDQGAGLW